MSKDPSIRPLWEEIKVKAAELADRVNTLIANRGNSDLMTSIPYFDMAKERLQENCFDRAKSN